MENRLYTDEMYDLVLQYRKTKLWQKLCDSQVFAVRHEDGTIGYCCAMGNAGEVLALAVYPEGEGLQSYLRLLFAEDDGEDAVLNHEKTVTQNCVSLTFDSRDEIPPKQLEWVKAYCKRRGVTLRGKWAYPCIQRMEPRRLFWEIMDEKQMDYLRDGVLAALEVSRRLETETAKQLGLVHIDEAFGSCPLLTRVKGGYKWSQTRLPRIQRAAYPEANLVDSPGLEKLRRKPTRAGCEWAARVFVFAIPITENEMKEGEEPLTAPMYPYMYVVVDVKSHMVLATNLCMDEAGYAHDLVSDLFNIALQHEKPERILVMDDRTDTLLGQLKDKVGIEVERREQIETLSEAVDELFANADGQSGNMDDADEQMDEVFSAIVEHPEALHDMPNMILNQLVLMAEHGMMPLDAQAVVAKEIRRRKRMG